MMLEQNYLAHYGIKGQSWGIRRFQNEDGTLTEEGKQRYGIDDNTKYSAKDLEFGKAPKDASEKALALRRKQIEKVRSNLKTQTIIQSVLGASMFAVGTYQKSHGGDRFLGNILQKAGLGYLLGTGLGYAVGTGSSNIAKNILKKEQESRLNKS